MEIIVEGRAKEFFLANEVIMNIDFITKNEKYDEVLQDGIKMVNDFIQEVLLKNKFNEEDLKTKSFITKEEKKYNELTHKYDFDGYSFNQNASLKFDYDNERLVNIINAISKLDNPPLYQINFGIKDKNETHKRLLTKAYNDAKEHADIIATAAGKELIKCIKVDFKPLSLAKNNTTQIISNIFTPEDIEITETLYCIWIAE